jgi:tetratricopeptide (TPR) repeat protein
MRSYLDETFIAVRAVRERNMITEGTPRDELFTQYDVRYTPTVMIATADGQEIDRMVGYESPVEEYKQKLIAVYTGDQTILSMVQAHEKTPDDLEIIVNLAMKYQTIYANKKMAEFGEKALQQADNAKEMTISYGDDEAEVSAYEYARATTVYGGPQYALDFMNEFPESAIKSDVFHWLSRFLYSGDTRPEAFRVYDELVQKFPADMELLKPYVYYCARGDEYVDKGIEFAEKIYKADPANTETRLAQSYAGLLLAKGEDEKAINAFGQDFVDRHTENEEAGPLNGYAWFWALKGKNLESALAAAKKSIEFDDQHFTWDTLSMVYWKMGEHQKAIEAEEKALEMAGGENAGYEERIEEIKVDMQ